MRASGHDVLSKDIMTLSAGNEAAGYDDSIAGHVKLLTLDGSREYTTGHFTATFEAGDNVIILGGYGTLTDGTKFTF